MSQSHWFGSSNGAGPSASVCSSKHSHVPSLIIQMKNKFKEKISLTENVVEEVAVIVVRLKPLVQSWSALIHRKTKLTKTLNTNKYQHRD